MCEKSKNFGKSIILLVSDFFRVVDVSKMRRFFLLLRNLEEECLLSTIYGFSRSGPDYKICNIRTKS
jgi:hypothetical protein